jgi:CRISPR type IV-associated protein Csf3
MRRAYEPLKITARFQSNVLCDQAGWLPLDGPLWYQAHRHALGVEQATLPGGSPGSNRKINMPLKIIHAGTEDWYFACSWAQPRPWWAEEGQSYWAKRFDTKYSGMVDFGKRRGKIIVEQGFFKAYRMPLFYKTAKRACWYCIGDKAGIEELLSTLTHIGKKTSQGWGRVVWTVESWHSDWSVWRDGQLMRGVPQEDALELIKQHGRFAPFDIVNYGLRPSYYRSENQRMLAVPHAQG